MNCDICSAPGTGTHVSSDDMRHAVNVNGFNPFSQGLACTAVMTAMGGNAGEMFEQWKAIMVAGDTTGWTVCPRCMSKLEACLSRTRSSAKPSAKTTSAQLPRKTGKKWYEFWK